MKKFLFSSFLVASLASSLLGVDLLASLTNGKISDNSPGVRVLSLEEAKQVKGGYTTDHYQLSNNEMLAIFIPTVQSEIEAGNLIGTALVTATGHVPYRTITQQVIGYKVTKNISSSNGRKYAYFTYDVMSLDLVDGGLRKITTSSLLNNNYVVKILANQYKNSFENRLGGYSVK